MNMQAALYVVIPLLLISGCIAWEPSEPEAVYLVENFYLFSRGGKAVDVEIVSRGDYIGKCKCYPITFKISIPDKPAFDKTFYFFKNESGIVEIREHMPG